MDSKLIIGIVVILFILIIGFLFLGDNVNDVGTKTVKVGDKISVHYTGKLENGDIFDSSIGKQPLSFTAGGGQMIQGFDEAVIGMKVGEKKTVTLPPEKAYGTSGAHPLAGKTLIFELQIVEIKE